MKNLLLLLSTMLLSSALFAQKDYESGYYISNDGVKSEGYIKTSNFRMANDESFNGLDFKKSLDQDAIKIDKSAVSEFGVDQKIKIQKRKALIDDVSFFKDYSYEKSFSLQEKVVFLNVLVEGNATLYSYDGGQGIKYLWKKVDQDDIVKQFLYKKYYKSASLLTENNTFREQLFNNIKCTNQTYPDFLNLKYDKTAFVAIFDKYNKCNNGNSIIYKAVEERKITVRGSIFFGYNFAKFQIVNSTPERSAERFSMPSFGAEVEVLTMSNKLGFFFSGAYRKAEASSAVTIDLSEFNPNTTTNTVKLDTGMLDFVLGSRYYFSLGKAGSLFLGGGLGINIPLSNNLIDYQTNNFNDLSAVAVEVTMQSKPFVRLQLGYIFNDHYGINFHYDTPKNLLGDDKAKLQEAGINFKYTF